MEAEGVIESELAHQAGGGERLIQAEEVALAQKSGEAVEELVQMWAAAAAAELEQTNGEAVEYETQMQMASAMQPAVAGVSCLLVGEVLSKMHTRLAAESSTRSRFCEGWLLMERMLKCLQS